MPKLHIPGRGEGDPEFIPVVWDDVCEYLEQGPRFCLSTRQDPVELMGELVGCLGDRCWLLLVVLYPHGGIAPGRYQSPALTRDEVRDFLRDFNLLLGNDSNLDFWIGDFDDGGLIVFTSHGTMYLYGPLRSFATLLTQRGFTRGEVRLPVVHSHLFDDAHNAEVARALSRWDWSRSELQPGDG